MSVISNHRSMQKHLYTYLSRAPSLWTYTITGATDGHQIQPHTVMGLYANHKYRLKCVFQAWRCDTRLCKLHRAVNGAQVSVIPCLQHCALNLSLTLHALKIGCARKYTAHRENHRNRKKQGYTHIRWKCSCCKQVYEALGQLWRRWLP